MSKAVDAMVSSMEGASLDDESKKQKQRNYESECREKFSTADGETNSNFEVETLDAEKEKEITGKSTDVGQHRLEPSGEFGEKLLEEVTMLSYPRKLTVLYELLSACLADVPEDSKKAKQKKRGYDARHRVALRMITTWFDIKWVQVVNLCLFYFYFYY